MADDDKQGDEFDPWAELESTPEAEGGFGGAFDTDARPDDAAPPPSDAPSAEAEEAAGFTSDPGAGLPAADDEVADWLAEITDDEGADAEGDRSPLGVFAGDDEPPTFPDPADPEAVRVGTGESGIIDDDGDDGGFSDAVAEQSERSEAATTEGGFGWDSIEVESSIDPAPFGVVGSELDDDAGDDVDFAGLATGGEPDEGAADVGAAAVAAVGTAGAVNSSVKAPRRQRAKKGGLGQMVGVVMGGLLALPITFAILIWGFHKDPLNLVRHVPESMAFLFPQELVPGARRSVGDGVVGGPTLDDVPAVAGVEGEAVIPDEPVGEPAAEPVAVVDDGSQEPSSDPLMTATDGPATDTGVVGDPVPDTPTTDPVAVAATGPTDSPAPSVDPFGDLAPVMPSPSEPAALVEPQVVDVPTMPEPEPLDLSAIDAAVAAADEASAAVEASDADADPDPVRQTRRRNRLLVEWYRQLSHVAEELSSLERVAADGGRPLDGPPESVARLQEALVGDPSRVDDLARLSRDWLAYKGRSTSGIVMPGVLAGTRHVGPYWCSTVTVAAAGDLTRDLAVISRSEPAAVPGDAVLVTGLIVDGDTLWASDVRPAAADAATTIDPFAAPAP